MIFEETISKDWLWIALGLSLACGSPHPPTEIDFQPQTFPSQSGEAVDGELGRLRVPERHEAPGGPSIELAVARFASTSPGPAPTLIYLEGGPGGPAKASH